MKGLKGRVSLDKNGTSGGSSAGEGKKARLFDGLGQRGVPVGKGVEVAWESR